MKLSYNKYFEFFGICLLLTGSLIINANGGFIKNDYINQQIIAGMLLIIIGAFTYIIDLED